MFRPQLTVDDVTTWLHDKPLGRAVTVLLILLAAIIVRSIWRRFVQRITGALTVSKLSERLATSAAGADSFTVDRYRARANAVARLLVSVGTFVIFAFALILALARLGFDVAPLLASAGVLGIAIGFGAQTIIRDFLSGVFMIMENQYGLGDTVTVSGITGTIEDVGLRITRLRDIEGTLWYVTNGSITELGNRSQGWSLAVVDVPVGYGADLDKVHDVLATTARALQSDPDWTSTILSDDVQVAAESMTPQSVTFRVRLHTQPGQQLAVGRELRLRELGALDAAGVAAPTPAAADEQP